MRLQRYWQDNHSFRRLEVQGWREGLRAYFPSWCFTLLLDRQRQRVAHEELHQTARQTSCVSATSEARVLGRASGHSAQQWPPRWWRTCRNCPFYHTSNLGRKSGHFYHQLKVTVQDKAETLNHKFYPDFPEVHNACFILLIGPFFLTNFTIIPFPVLKGFTFYPVVVGTCKVLSHDPTQPDWTSRGQLVVISPSPLQLQSVAVTVCPNFPHPTLLPTYMSMNMHHLKLVSDWLSNTEHPVGASGRSFLKSSRPSHWPTRSNHDWTFLVGPTGPPPTWLNYTRLGMSHSNTELTHQFSWVTLDPVSSVWQLRF